MTRVFDTIIVGLGAMGSATAYQLSKTSKKVLGIDQFDPPHNNGSSHGDTRITRQAIGEGRQYTPIVLRSNQIWEEIENATGKELYNHCGGLIFGPSNINTVQHGQEGFLNQTIEVAKEFHIQHELLEHAELVRRFPQFRYLGDEIAYYEPGAGFLRPEVCIETQLKLAKNNGAEIRTKLQVLAIEPNFKNDGVSVITSQGTFQSETLVITAGPWLNQFLPENLQHNFKIYRQVLFWFETELNIEAYSVKNFPVYLRLDKKPENTFYGFPAIDGLTGGIKLAGEKFESTCSPKTVDRNISDKEVEDFYSQFSKYISINSKCVHSATCLYTVTPDYNFVIDHLPNHPQIIIASACSGHGFKHSAGIGSTISELINKGKSSIDISSFAFSSLF